MMAEHTGIVNGPGPLAQAIVLAGVLAEAGVTRLERSGPGAGEILPARSTDLPGIIVEAWSRGAPLQLACTQLGLLVELTTDGLRWRTADARTAALFKARP